MFKLKNISITDDEFSRVFNLHTTGKDMNFELLENMRDYCLSTWPDEADEINREIDDMVYDVKKKLARKGIRFNG